MDLNDFIYLLPSGLVVLLVLYWVLSQFFPTLKGRNGNKDVMVNKIFNSYTDFLDKVLFLLNENKDALSEFKGLSASLENHIREIEKRLNEIQSQLREVCFKIDKLFDRVWRSEK